MAQKTKNPSFRALIDRFTDELTAAIAAQVEEQVAAALSHLRTAAPRSDGRRSGRVCPVPGCGKPGAGPRNRWFCKEHARRLSASEQKGILERNRRLIAEGKTPAPPQAQRIVRLPARTPRPRRSLDMSCRVEGCPNRSRGPRAGYICDQHRAELSSEQQDAARRTWNERRKGQALPAPEQPKAPPSPVPPIVRKAEPAEA
ncbi:MAG TPA: hypothetical protein VFL36_23285 [Myxococcales bacterium]|nr:hypothetical protein [Myxococcales bacterium]